MENKKVFIGNLDFEVTENEVKNLLSKYGTVVSVKMHQKKGFAFIEMGDAEEAAKAVQKLDGVKYKDREMRVSIEMKPGKAKSVSVKRYKERGQSISKERSGNSSDSRSRSEKYRDTQKQKPADRDRNQRPVNGNSKGRSTESDERPSGENRKERPGLPRPERDRWATERPAEAPRTVRKEWTGDKPEFKSRPARDENREGYGSYGRSFEKSLEKSGDRSTGTGNRPLKDFTKESTRGPRAPKREWTPEKPSYSEKKPYSDRPARDGERSSRGRSSGSDERPSREGSRERTGSPRPPKREWTAEKPSYSERKPDSGRPARDGERSSSPRPPRKEWSSDRPARPSRETGDSWKEKPARRDSSDDKPRDYSKPRSVSGSQNRFSRSSSPKSGPGTGRGASRPKPGGGNRDRSKPSKD